MRRETIDFHFYVGFVQIKHILHTSFNSKSCKRILVKILHENRLQIAASNLRQVRHCTYMWTTTEIQRKWTQRAKCIERQERNWDVSFCVIMQIQARPNRFLQKACTLYVLQTEALFVCAATFMYIMNRMIKHCLVRDAHRHRTNAHTHEHVLN